MCLKEIWGEGGVCVDADSAGTLVIFSGWVRERSTTGQREEMGHVAVQLDKYCWNHNRLTGKQIKVFGSARVSAGGRPLPTACLKSSPACFYSATSDGGSSTAKRGEVTDTHASEPLNPGGRREQHLTLVVNPIRLVHRVSAGVGAPHEAGRSQCMHGLLWVVGLGGWRHPGRSVLFAAPKILLLTTEELENGFTEWLNVCRSRSYKRLFIYLPFLLPGILGELDLAAQHILAEIGTITYMVRALLRLGRLFSWEDLTCFLLVLAVPSRRLCCCLRVHWECSGCWKHGPGHGHL